MESPLDFESLRHEEITLNDNKSKTRYFLLFLEIT